MPRRPSRHCPDAGPLGSAPRRPEAPDARRARRRGAIRHLHRLATAAVALSASLVIAGQVRADDLRADDHAAAIAGDRASPTTRPGDANVPSDCVLAFSAEPQFAPGEMALIWRPIMERVAALSNCRISVSHARSMGGFTDRLGSGAPDLVYATPYHLLVSHRRQGYLPLVRSGSTMLKGIVVVERDSGPRDVTALHRRTVAFPAPGAFAASLLTRRALEEEHDITVRRDYLGNHASVYLAVVQGIALAGGGDNASFSRLPERIRARLRVVHMTEPYAPAAIAIHPRVPAEDRRRVREALLSVAATGPALFDAVPMPHPVSASLADYDDVVALGLAGLAHPAGGSQPGPASGGAR